MAREVEIDITVLVNRSDCFVIDIPKTNHMQRTSSLLAIITVSVLFVTINACKRLKEVGGGNHDKGWIKFPYVPTDSNQIVVWKKPGVSDEVFQKWLRDSFPTANTLVCKNCDNNLVLINFPNILSHPTGQTSTAGSTGHTTRPSGDDGPAAFYSGNFPMLFSDTLYTRPYKGDN